MENFTCDLLECENKHKCTGIGFKILLIIISTQFGCWLSLICIEIFTIFVYLILNYFWYKYIQLYFDDAIFDIHNCYDVRVF